MKKKTKTTESYICEGCGTSHSDKYGFGKCAICGKEVCKACKVVKDIDCGCIESGEDSCELTFYDGSYEHQYKLCHDCSSKYKQRIHEIECKNYEEYIKLICKFNEDNDNLVKQVLEEIKGLGKNE